jgi:hypothetical protein
VEYFDGRMFLNNGKLRELIYQLFKIIAILHNACVAYVCSKHSADQYLGAAFNAISSKEVFM